MARLRPVIPILLRLILSFPSTCALSVLLSVPLGHAAGLASPECVEKLDDPSSARYPIHESLEIGLPVAWLVITKDGCGAGRTTHMEIHWDGLILFGVVAAVGYELASWLYLRLRRARVPAADS
jgi:hypothetical protein